MGNGKYEMKSHEDPQPTTTAFVRFASEGRRAFLADAGVRAYGRLLRAAEAIQVIKRANEDLAVGERGR